MVGSAPREETLGFNLLPSVTRFSVAVTAIILVVSGEKAKSRIWKGVEAHCRSMAPFADCTDQFWSKNAVSRAALTYVTSLQSIEETVNSVPSGRHCIALIWST